MKHLHEDKRHSHPAYGTQLEGGGRERRRQRWVCARVGARGQTIPANSRGSAAPEQCGTSAFCASKCDTPMRCLDTLASPSSVQGKHTCSSSLFDLHEAVELPWRDGSVVGGGDRVLCGRPWGAGSTNTETRQMDQVDRLVGITARQAIFTPLFAALAQRARAQMNKKQQPCSASSSSWPPVHTRPCSSPTPRISCFTDSESALCTLAASPSSPSPALPSASSCAHTAQQATQTKIRQQDW